MERRLAAILVADVAGYSRLMGKDEAGTLQRLKACEQKVIEPTVERHKGRIVKRMGDGYLVEFASVVDAVECAVAWQETMANASDIDQIRFRMGINVGDVIFEGEDIYGDGVNIAARLEALAEPGGLCLSGSARDQLSGKVDLAFEPLGVQSLKNIVEPVAVYRLTPRSFGKRGRDRQAPDVDLSLPARPSMAVLPFQNMSADPEQEFFADGLTEDIITRLSYLRDLLVIARTSTFAYKGRAVRVEDVARDLGVGHVLEGSVRKVGNRVRITAQLIDGSTGGHLWAQRYDRDLTDVFEIQDEITHAIVVAMQVELTDGEAAGLERGGTRDLDAWEAFHRGVLALLKYTKDDNLEARRLFEQAFKLDHDFLDAKVYLAWTYWIAARHGQVPDRAGAVARSRELLEEIKTTGAVSANAKHLEACQFMIEDRHQEARETATIANRLGPCRLFGYAPAAQIYMYCGDAQTALDLLRMSMRLSPFCPDDVVYYLAYSLAWVGDYENAIQAAEEYDRRLPGYVYTYTLQSMIFDFAGDLERSASAIRILRKLYPTFRLGDFISHESYRDPKDLDRVVEALRRAGLPE